MRWTSAKSAPAVDSESIKTGQSHRAASSEESPLTADDDRPSGVPDQDADKGDPLMSKRTKESDQTRGASAAEGKADNSEGSSVTPEQIRQLGLGKQLAETIRRTTPQEQMTQGVRNLLDQLDKMVPINLTTIAEGDQILMNEPEEWPEVEFEVTLDSGSVVHVCSHEDTLGYLLEPSPGSKRNQLFVMGDGNKIPNQGQKQLKLTSSQNSDIRSTFQIAAVTRPLMSVGRICDEGLEISFDAKRAMVRDKSGRDACRFNRDPRSSPGLNLQVGS